MRDTGTRALETRAIETLAIAVLAPTGRDGGMAARVLAAADFPIVACAGMSDLCDAIAREVGAVLVAEEALARRGADQLLRMLDLQPAWSDVPIVVLTGEGELSRTLPRGLASLAARTSVTLLERPVRVATLVTVLRSALRARERQHEVRDHLAERARLLASERAARRDAEAAALQAEQANRAKSSFLAMMSHELRTPLNAIGGYAQLIEMGLHGPVTPEQNQALARIERSQRHLLSLINDVLDFAKLEAGHVTVASEPVAMREVLLDVEALVLPQMRARSLRLVDAGECGEVVALGDVEKVRQVLVNLVSNAIKFTEPGGEIRLHCVADDTTVRTIVADSGSGIPAAQLESIFEPFVQVDRSLASPQEGTGLGLAISRDLARRMGGELTVESTVGAGSAFTLALPRAVPADVDATPPAADDVPA